MCRKDWPSKVHLLRNLVRYSTEDLLNSLTSPDVTCDSPFVLNSAHRSAIRAVQLLCKSESDSLRCERLEMIPALQGCGQSQITLCS
ncbi:hypothetical protein T05_15585 [Trichinella murrelli]|uniref:Uncharacterized protein n=1 Tax=Trichinella murrelli TaxID=144512 RepID=A0A0V0T915_9BILA|nr:hypothetical protein T05_15585 [Trichinella murrelli]